MVYVTYRLLYIRGEGHQPYWQLSQVGVQFEGGLFKFNDRMLAYLSGDNVTDVLNAASAWGMQEITGAEALTWSETALPVNTEVDDLGTLKYVGPAEFDADGRIVRPLSETLW